MPGIADIIMRQMATAGQPRIARETSTVTAPGEGLDIGPIIMMLMMSKLFKGGAPGATESLGMTGGVPQGRDIPPGLTELMSGGFPGASSMGGGVPSPNVGVPTSPRVGQTPTPAPRDMSGIPLQAPQNLEQLMMIVDLLSKMDRNPYA